MITIYSIPNCPNCKHLKMLLDRKGISYGGKQFDPDNEDDMAEMSYMGIYTAQFPVVEIDGERLPAMTVCSILPRPCISGSRAAAIGTRPSSSARRR